MGFFWRLSAVVEELSLGGVPILCRPVILPDYAELDLKIPDDARCPAWVCFDGKQVSSHCGRGCSYTFGRHSAQYYTCNFALHL